MRKLYALIIILFCLAAAAQAAVTSRIERVVVPYVGSGELDDYVIPAGFLAYDQDNPQNVRIGDGVTPGGLRVCDPAGLTNTQYQYYQDTHFNGNILWLDEDTSMQAADGILRIRQEGEAILTLYAPTNNLLGSIDASEYWGDGTNDYLRIWLNVASVTVQPVIEYMSGAPSGTWVTVTNAVYDWPPANDPMEILLPIPESESNGYYSVTYPTQDGKAMSINCPLFVPEIRATTLMVGGEEFSPTGWAQATNDLWSAIMGLAATTSGVSSLGASNIAANVLAASLGDSAGSSAASKDYVSSNAAVIATNSASNVVAAALTDYSTTAETAALYRSITNPVSAAVVAVSNLSYISGSDVQSCLSFLDDLLANGGGGLPLTNIGVQSAYITGPAIIETYDAYYNYDMIVIYSNDTAANVSTSASWSISSDCHNQLLNEGDASIYCDAPYFESNIVLSATYTWLGQTITATKNILVDPENPAVPDSISVAGATSIHELASSSYTATLHYTRSFSEDITDAASWSAAGVATNSGNILTAGQVVTSQIVRFTASYAGFSGYEDVTVVNTQQHLVFNIEYTGLQSAGTLYIYGYTNAAMNNWPVWQTTIAYTPSMYGAYPTNFLASEIRYLGAATYSGPTWWYCFLDINGNGYPNGDFKNWTTNSYNYSYNDLDINEPDAIGSGQTTSAGPEMAAGESTSITFSLDDSFPGQGWGTNTYRTMYVMAAPGRPHAPPLGTTSVVFSTVNRSYICEQDMLNHGITWTSSVTWFLSSITNPAANGLAEHFGYQP